MESWPTVMTWSNGLCMKCGHATLLTYFKRKKKSISLGKHLSSSFGSHTHIWRQFWNGWTDNQQQHLKMGWEHLHRNHETDDVHPVTGSEESLAAATGLSLHQLTSSVTVWFCCSSSHTEDNSSGLSTALRQPSASCPPSETLTCVMWKNVDERWFWPVSAGSYWYQNLSIINQNHPQAEKRSLSLSAL